MIDFREDNEGFVDVYSDKKRLGCLIHTKGEWVFVTMLNALITVSTMKEVIKYTDGRNS